MRPRQSWSCVVCKRRKVRCGKEQPACANCVRNNGACAYENNSTDWASQQAKRKHTSGPSHNEAAPSPPATEEPLSVWAAQQRNSPPSQTFSIASQIEAEETSNLHTPRHYSVPASSSLDRQHGNHNDRPFSQTLTDIGSSFFPSSRPQDLSLASKSVASWEMSSQEDCGHPLQLATPSLTSSTTGNSALLTSPKRRRTADHHASASSRDVVLEDPTHREKRMRASEGLATSDAGEDTFRHVGYLSIKNGGRIRHVGDTFWGLIKGYVSRYPILGSLLFWIVPDHATGIAL